MTERADHPTAEVGLFDRLHREGVISAEAMARARALVAGPPAPAPWHTLLSFSALAFGVALAVAGVIFLMAYNWADLSRVARVGLVGALAAVAAGFAAWRSDRPAGRVALTGAAVLVGGTLAAYGQSYQTGADAWQLFAGWAALITPWVIGAGYGPLWLVWAAVAQVAIPLYWDQALDPERLGELLLPVIMALPPLVPWLLAEWRDLSGYWWRRVLALQALAPMTVAAIIPILDFKYFDGISALSWLIWAAVIAATLAWYRRGRPDLFMVALGGLSVATFVGGLSAWVLFEAMNADLLGLLLFAGIILGEVVALAWWLRRIHQQQGGT